MKTGTKGEGIGNRDGTLRFFLVLPALIIIFLLAISIVTPCFASELTATMKTQYFTIHYNPADKLLAELTAKTAFEELMRISRDLGYRIEPNKPLPLMVYRTHYAFIKEGGLKDSYTVGTARTGDERIAVDASGAFVTTKQVLGHEITHAVIFRILGNRVNKLPLWVNEGLAKYESEVYIDTDNNIVADAAANGSIIPLSNLNSAFPNDRKDLAYAESASAVRYLVKWYGPSVPKNLLSGLAATDSFDKAIAKTTGESSNQFLSDWANSLSRRFGLLRVWRIAGACGGVVMAGLVVVAFIIRRRRMALAAKEWEWEQFEESMERQLREWPHR